MKSWRAFALLMVAAGVVLSVACSDDKPTNTVTVTRAEFGDEWPLTVDAGELACDGDAGIGSVTFTTAAGTTYAVNGIARDRTDFPEIDAVWADQPTTNPALAGLKISMGPLIDRGLELCR